MTKHNLQAHAVDYLLQGLANKASEGINFGFFDPATCQQAQPILEAIVQEMQAAEKVDEMIKVTAKSWTEFNYVKEAALIKKEFGANGEQLLAIFENRCEHVIYLILSALLNSKKKREDIKLCTFEQIASHTSMIETGSNPKAIRNQNAVRAIFLILKLLLEQDLLSLALRKEDDVSFEDPQVSLVRDLWLALMARIRPANFRDIIELLNSFTDFKAPNVFAKCSKAETCDTVNKTTSHWIIGVLFGLGLLMAIFCKMFYL